MVDCAVDSRSSEIRIAAGVVRDRLEVGPPQASQGCVLPVCVVIEAKDGVGANTRARSRLVARLILRIRPDTRAVLRQRRDECKSRRWPMRTAIGDSGRYVSVGLVAEVRRRPAPRGRRRHGRQRDATYTTTRPTMRRARRSVPVHIATGRSWKVTNALGRSPRR